MLEFLTQKRAREVESGMQGSWRVRGKGAAIERDRTNLGEGEQDGSHLVTGTRCRIAVELTDVSERCIVEHAGETIQQPDPLTRVERVVCECLHHPHPTDGEANERVVDAVAALVRSLG